MHLNEILAQATTAPQTTQPATPAAPPGWMSFAPMILLVIVFYFILIRPQQKRAKQQAALIQNLKSGDKVVTTSGIVGVVITVKDKTVSVRSGDAKFEVTKASVTEILQGGDATES
ncbi:MAG: preprotein translocase subunit YajC [Limisphaerales bacterium]